jgi:uncharacterized protein YcbK (DUF882 family)
MHLFPSSTCCICTFAFTRYFFTNNSAVEVRQRTRERQQEKEAKLDAFLETTRARVGKDKDPTARALVVKAKGASGGTDDHAVVSAGKDIHTHASTHLPLPPPK